MGGGSGREIEERCLNSFCQRLSNYRLEALMMEWNI